MFSLWKRAIDTQKALMIDGNELSPDSLLKRVEEFEGLSQAAEHSYPALILTGGEEPNAMTAESNDKAKMGISRDPKDHDEEIDGTDNGADYEGSDFDSLETDVESSVPFGSLPIDSIAERLSRDC